MSATTYTHIGTFVEDAGCVTRERVTNDPAYRQEYLAKHDKHLVGGHRPLPYPMTRKQALVWSRSVTA